MAANRKHRIVEVIDDNQVALLKLTGLSPEADDENVEPARGIPDPKRSSASHEKDPYGPPYQPVATPDTPPSSPPTLPAPTYKQVSGTTATVVKKPKAKRRRRTG